MDGRYSGSELGLIRSIRISEAQRQALQDHAQKHDPNESCAILYGRIEGDLAVVKDFFLAYNADGSQSSFTISNEQLIAAYGKAEESNAQVIGIFHSHPDSEARPSGTDRQFMEINPVVWVIYSGSSSDFRAFVLEDQIQEIEVSG